MLNNESIIETFQVKKDDLRNFVLLSGDKNSLHVDPLFSNRSNYKNCIVHGMLPILFLSKFKKRKGSHSLKLTKIVVNFEQPVFLNDELTIQVDIGIKRIEFLICNKLSGNQVTNGYALYKESDKKTNSKKTEESKANKPIVLDDLDEAIYQFDDIYVGLKEKINILISKEHIQLLNKILGVNSNHQPLIEKIDLLILSSISTLIGMKLPGQLATFTNFFLEFNYQALLGNSYTLEAEVSFKSRSTRLIKTNVSFIDSKTNKKCIVGYVKTKINSPHTIMPSIDELHKNNVDFGLQKKVALITGSSRGIGETTAKLLALHGANVVINYHKSKIEAEKIVEEINLKGGNAIAIKADVSDKKQVLNMFTMINSNFGRVDILVNNAVGSFQPIGFEDLSWDQVQKDIEIIVKGAFNCSQEAIKSMKKNHSGKIVNLTTIATEIPPKNQGKYVIAKSALVGLTRSLAVELAAYNIQVNMVSPSFVETDLTNNINELFKDKIRLESPMQRFANSVEVANAVLYLSSSMSSFVSGQKITLGGGQPPFL